jgi:salicylate biosynthesis isochorismate synthase/menaquinone-specific isochorismate synthase
VTLRTAPGPNPFALEAPVIARLEERVRRAIAYARREVGPAYAAVTADLPADVDPAAAVLAARRHDDRFYCLEQPDRHGFALASVGEAALVEASGPDRFADASKRARTLSRRVFGGDATGPMASGPVWVGGFAFAADGGRAPEWHGLRPAQLVLPEVAIARHRGEARLTVCAAVDPDDEPEAVIGRVLDRLDSMSAEPMPLIDPDPAVRSEVSGAAPPSHFEEAVRRAVERIRAGDLEKIVLAREVRVHAPRPIDPAPVFGGLREVFPACFCYCVGTPELAFVGASPELLVRREGQRAQTVALAGTARRSADPAVDDHLGEQLAHSPKNREEHAIVARRIQGTLDPVSLWTAVADEPVLVRVHNVQHLATPIRAQLRQPRSAVELAGLLHPTPAVGGEPRSVAEPLIPALEGLDRGWYAGAIGWMDLAEDGEFCVGLRCALLRDRVAHLYSGCGIVGDSDPAEELAESEVKLQALLPLLA